MHMAPGLIPCTGNGSMRGGTGCFSAVDVGSLSERVEGSVGNCIKPWRGEAWGGMGMGEVGRGEQEI